MKFQYINKLHILEWHHNNKKASTMQYVHLAQLTTKNTLLWPRIYTVLLLFIHLSIDQGVHLYHILWVSWAEIRGESKMQQTLVSKVDIYVSCLYKIVYRITRCKSKNMTLNCVANVSLQLLFKIYRPRKFTLTYIFNDLWMWKLLISIMQVSKIDSKVFITSK